MPGFMLMVIWLALLTVAAERELLHTPAPPPATHRNCTTLPLWKLLPKTVSCWAVLLAAIAVGLTLFT